MRSLLFATLVACAMMPRVAPAADEDCLTANEDAAKRAHEHVNVYLGELKTMTDNLWARNAASVCSSALARAERYSKRLAADNELCMPGSTYVDSQALQLYKTAQSTCRSEFTNVLSKMSADEQRPVTERVAKATAGFR